MKEILTDNDFERFRKLIYDESGIHFSSSNRTILESRLKERLRIQGLEKIADYHQMILESQDEMRVLLDSVTTNLTRFFRNNAHFQAFEYYVIPELVKRKSAQGDHTIRIWSAGCSTGEEPFSLAITMKEILPPRFDYDIVASDISLKSLMAGKEGYYRENRVSGVPEKYLQKYFDRKSEGYQIKTDIKKRIRFDYHNLKHVSGLRSVDVVFCRNVLIYFDEAAQKAAVNRFWDVMAPDSFLFIGHSESLFGMDTRYEFLKTKWACIYKKTR
jgi:chemotaxis protein methyltransferase CheR